MVYVMHAQMPAHTAEAVIAAAVSYIEHFMSIFTTCKYMYVSMHMFTYIST